MGIFSNVFSNIFNTGKEIEYNKDKIIERDKRLVGINTVGRTSPHYYYGTDSTRDSTHAEKILTNKCNLFTNDLLTHIEYNGNQDDLIIANLNVNIIISKIQQLGKDPEDYQEALLGNNSWRKTTKEMDEINDITKRLGFKRVVYTTKDREVIYNNIKNLESIITTLNSNAEGAMETGVQMLCHYKFKY